MNLELIYGTQQIRTKLSRCVRGNIWSGDEAWSVHACVSHYNSGSRKFFEFDWMAACWDINNFNTEFVKFFRIFFYNKNNISVGNIKCLRLGKEKPRTFPYILKVNFIKKKNRTLNLKLSKTKTFNFYSPKNWGDVISDRNEVYFKYFKRKYLGKEGWKSQKE